MPAVLLIGGKISFLQSIAVGVAGVLFGIGISAIVHNYLIVQEHGELMYPESMAISETLVASEGAKESIINMGIGFGIGGVLTVLTSSFLNVANNVISYVNESFYKFKFEVEGSPLLLGIGFIVGMKVSLIMFVGSILANFAILPLIGYFAGLGGGGATVWNNPSVAINLMQVSDISGSYVKYIGAGMMLSGGLIGAIKLMPTIVVSVKKTFNAKSSNSAESSILGKLILVSGVIICFVAGFLISDGNILMAIIASILSLILAFLFVIVSGRLTGVIGCSNLPVSGMTIASLVLVTLLFVVMGWRSPENNKSLLLFGTFIVTAISIGGGYSQSQKVGFIIGGNKNEMQKYFAIAALVGVIVVVGTIMVLSSKLAMTGDNVPFALPQANLMSTLTSGILSGELPWVMIIVGAVMGIVIFLLKLPVMTVAIGFYLPLSTTSIILIGALVRLFIEKTSKSPAEKDIKVSNGISLSAGLVAGGSILGLVGIILHVSGVLKGTVPSGFASTNGMAFIMLAVLIVVTIIPILRSKVKDAK